MSELPANFNYKDYPILIIDDDKAFLMAFVDEFSADFTIFWAEDAQKGMKIVGQHKNLALVLTDQRMPGVTGVQLLGEIKTKHPNITRVLITAYADIEAAIDAINIGDIFKYISKPYKFEEVKQIIQRGIARYYLAKESRRSKKEETQRLRQDIDKENLEKLNELTYGLSHHFKNRLSAAVTFFDLLPDKLKELIENMPRGVDKKYWYNFSEIAEEGIRNIVELINDLFAYSSMREYTFEQADIIRLLNAEKKVFSSLAQEKQVDIQYNLPQELPSLSLDTLKMTQALENIVLNAIQATPPKGAIKISAERQRGAVRISIADDGAGIEHGNLKKVIYPFFTTKGPQAKGLGLSIADTIIRQHSGEIKVQSKSKQGTNIVINLPLES